jgi:hypothetical protein
MMSRPWQVFRVDADAGRVWLRPQQNRIANLAMDGGGLKLSLSFTSVSLHLPSWTWCNRWGQNAEVHAVGNELLLPVAIPATQIKPKL